MIAHGIGVCNDPAAGWQRYLVRRGYAVNTRQHRTGLVRRWFTCKGVCYRAVRAAA